MEVSILMGWGSQFLIFGIFGKIFFFIPICKQKFLYANSENPDQMPHSTSFEQGLHYLHVSKIGLQSSNGQGFTNVNDHSQ